MNFYVRFPDYSSSLKGSNMAAIEKEMLFISRFFTNYLINKSEWYYVLYFVNFRMIDVLILTSDHTQKGFVRNLNRTSVSFLDPSMKKIRLLFWNLPEFVLSPLSEIILAHVRSTTRVATRVST